MTSHSVEHDRERARLHNGRFGYQTRSTADDVQLAAEHREPTVEDILRKAGYVEPPFRPYLFPYSRTRRKVHKDLLATMPPPSQMKAVDTESGTLHIPYGRAIMEFRQRAKNSYVAVPVALTKNDGATVKKYVSFTVEHGILERNALNAAPEGDEVDFYRELDHYVDQKIAGDFALRQEEAPGFGRDPRHWAKLLAGRARDRQAVAAAVVGSEEPRPVPAERIAKFFLELVEDLKPYDPRR